MVKYNADLLQKGACYSLAATCLFLPLSTALLSFFSLLTLLLWLLSGKFRDLFFLPKVSPVFLLALILLILFVIGVTYSSADISESLSYLKKYRELLFIPVVILLLRGQPKAQYRCENAFLLGCIILLLTSYCMYFSLIPSERYGNSILYHITHSFFISILAFFAVHKSIDATDYKMRAFWIAIFILSVFNMFYIAPGRIGMLVFIMLMVLLFIQRLSLVKQLISIAIMATLITIAFLTSDNFSSRSTLALQEIQAYEYGASRTSLGMRFDWWIDSIEIIKKNPFFGSGTGSFAVEHDSYIQGTKIKKTDNPHNEYLLVGVQLGLTGLTVFVLLLIMQIILSLKLKKPDRFYAQGIVVAMVIGCVINSFLYDTHQGHLWAIISSLYFSTAVD